MQSAALGPVNMRWTNLARHDPKLRKLAASLSRSGTTPGRLRLAY
ncbi:MAG: hypothetical protein AVDCRST_MAG31-40 [uncultured Sphingomonas sp.]|uniref:Uncharacterized protein n=1 Tax=uncultured Sphingomonas sp. TaxID=158754 RepID=A0A6J4SBA2_9SPHN|nr:MAG: hypothetical protein AVDCRST_MAG31-40 [uncultured Sphingomonas sp.]